MEFSSVEMVIQSLPSVVLSLKICVLAKSNTIFPFLDFIKSELISYVTSLLQMVFCLATAYLPAATKTSARKAKANGPAWNSMKTR